MKFLLDSELYSYFHQTHQFQESIVGFYACEIILALDYLHSLAIVYR